MRQLGRILIFAVAAIIALSSCKKEDPYVNVTGVSLDKTTLTIVEGESESLMATVNPSDADNKKVTWKSNNTSIATVDADGKVTAATMTGVKINNVTWATTNLDASGTFAANPEDYGMHYQWNRIKGWPVTGARKGEDGSPFDADDMGYYWTSIPHSLPGITSGWTLKVERINDISTRLTYDTSRAHSIRCVKK